MDYTARQAISKRRISIMFGHRSDNTQIEHAVQMYTSGGIIKLDFINNDCSSAHLIIVIDDTIDHQFNTFLFHTFKAPFNNNNKDILLSLQRRRDELYLIISNGSKAEDARLSISAAFIIESVLSKLYENSYALLHSIIEALKLTQLSTDNEFIRFHTRRTLLSLQNIALEVYPIFQAFLAMKSRGDSPDISAQSIAIDTACTKINRLLASEAAAYGAYVEMNKTSANRPTNN